MEPVWVREKEIRGSRRFDFAKSRDKLGLDDG